LGELNHEIVEKQSFSANINWFCLAGMKGVFISELRNPDKPGVETPGEMAILPVRAPFSKRSLGKSVVT